MTQNRNDEWHWDESQAEYLEGVDAQAAMDGILMRAAGTDDPNRAVEVLRGRPRAGKGKEETVRLQVVVPKSWQDELDRSAAEEHITRSAYLRELIRPRHILQRA